MLINDIPTLKAIIPTIVGDDIDRYQPFLKKADLWLITTITGQSVYDKLTAEGNDTILDLALQVVAHKAYYDAIPMLDLVETENGFGVVNNGNIAPASKERVEALRTQVNEMLSDASENLLDYLEASESWHADWQSSPAYTIISNSIIRTLNVFRQYAVFAGTRRDFTRLSPVMFSIQRRLIEPVISPELFAEILQQCRTNSLSDANATIIDDLRFALATATLSDRQYRSLFIDSPYMLKAAESLDPDQSPQQYLYRVLEELHANPDSYPAYKNSDTYARTLLNAQIANTPDSPLFITAL